MTSLYIYILESCTIISFPNGYMMSTNNDIYKAGTSLPVVCDSEYAAKSNSTTCTRSREWDPQPKCQLVVLCNDTTDVISDAVQSYPNIGIGLAGNVTYKSSHFYMKSGSLEVECQKDMKLAWKETPLFGNVVCIIILPFTKGLGFAWLKRMSWNNNP